MPGISRLGPGQHPSHVSHDVSSPGPATSRCVRAGIAGSLSARRCNPRAPSPEATDRRSPINPSASSERMALRSVPPTTRQDPGLSLHNCQRRLGCCRRDDELREDSAAKDWRSCPAARHASTRSMSGPVSDPSTRSRPAAPRWLPRLHRRWPIGPPRHRGSQHRQLHLVVDTVIDAESSGGDAPTLADMVRLLATLDCRDGGALDRRRQQRAQQTDDVCCWCVWACHSEAVMAARNSMSDAEPGPTSQDADLLLCRQESV